MATYNLDPQDYNKQAITIGGDVFVIGEIKDKDAIIERINNFDDNNLTKQWTELMGEILARFNDIVWPVWSSEYDVANFASIMQQKLWG